MSDVRTARWDEISRRIEAWWQREGLVLDVVCSRARPHAPWYLSSGLVPGLLPGEEMLDLEGLWFDARARARRAERGLQLVDFAGEAFPYYDTHLGPGSLAAFLGARVRLDEETIWFEPCMNALDAHPPLRLDPQQVFFRRQVAIVEEGLRVSRGRFPVGMPDLVANLDVLASLRGPQELMLDLLEQPEHVHDRLAQINRAWRAAFEHFHALIREPWGGNATSAFRLWGPGRTAVLQCDAAAMISPQMFAAFALEPLREQCRWIDHSMYHLDGTQSLRHLEQLLAIEELDAIEWTPQAGLPQGGDPRWYELYGRILAAGKSVQAIAVQPAQVLPLLEALGARGIFLMVEASSEAQARALVSEVRRRHPAP